jgi:hypothetical protein
MLENQMSRYGALTKTIGDRLQPHAKVFFAMHSIAEHVSSSTTGWLSQMLNEFPVDRDGVSRVHSTIQAAVDAAADGRGDVVIVGPGKWKEEVYIIKQGLKVLGPTAYGMGTGWDGARMRPSDASTHYAFTTKIGTAASGACFSVLAKGVEIAGFYFDGGGGYTGIYAGGGLNGCATGYGGTVYTTANASGLYVHDCFFRGGTEGTVGLYLNGPRFGVKIERNYFERWNGAGIEIDAGNANIENALILNNTFAANNGDYGIDIYGEANVKTTCIRENAFLDGVSAAFTAGINSRAGATGVTSVIGNYFCCATPMALLVSDGHAGNYKGTYNATEVYVSEA